jgi:hypothetical protein
MRANWHLDDLEDQAPKPATDPDATPDKQRDDVRTIVRRGKGTQVTEAALWDRRDEVEHPMPVGYWLEDRFTFLTPLDELLQREATLLEREQNMHDNLNIRCELKWDPGVTCSTCPVHEVGQDTPLSMLCRVGREQERIHTMVRVKQKTLEGTV